MELRIRNEMELRIRMIGIEDSTGRKNGGFEDSK